MRIEIEIPKEFEEHFKQDKFEDTLHRLSADAHLIAGNYEQETAIMLIKAFADSKPAYDVEKVVEAEENFLVNFGVPKDTKVHRKIIGIIRKGGAK